MLEGAVEKRKGGGCQGGQVGVRLQPSVGWSGKRGPRGVQVVWDSAAECSLEEKQEAQGPWWGRCGPGALQDSRRFRMEQVDYIREVTELGWPDPAGVSMPL